MREEEKRTDNIKLIFMEMLADKTVLLMNDDENLSFNYHIHQVAYTKYSIETDVL